MRSPWSSPFPILSALLWFFSTLTAHLVDAKCGSVPFVTLPTTFGIDKCFGNNKNALLKILATTTLDCSMIKLNKLSKSKPLRQAAEFVSTLASSPSTMSATLFDHMQQTNAATMDAFCTDYNKLLSPCAEALLPKLLNLAEKDHECCGELSDLSDLLNMVVPPNVHQDAFLLQDALNGINNLFCATRTSGDNAKQTCGTSIYSQLVTKYTKNEFHLLDHFLLPFVTMAKGEECDGMKGKTYSNTASLGTSSTLDFGCCTHHIRPLMESIQTSFSFLLGSTPIEFLNGIVEFPTDKSQAQFINAISNTASCAFDDKCSSPSGLATVKDRESAPNPKKPTEMGGDTVCEKIQKCDAGGQVCSEICKKGSVEIDPFVSQALKYQRTLAYKGPMCMAQLPATHNSAITLADGYGNRDQLMNANLDSTNKPYSFMKTNNHVLSLADQLRLGVRWLEIDVHYFLDDLRIAHCGGFGSASIQVLFDVIKKQLSAFGTVLWSPELLGCFPSLSGIKGDEQRTARHAFQEVRKWLDVQEDDKQKELVFVYLDTGSEVRDLGKFDQLNGLATEVFGDLIVPIQQLQLLEQTQWIGDGGNVTSMQQWIDQGYRVVLLANEDTGLAYKLKNFCKGHAILDTKFINETPTDPDRVIGERKIYSNEYFLRSYQSPLRYITLDERGQISRELPTLLKADNVANFVRWNVNLVATDQLDAAAMKAQVWSWAENEPKAKEGPTVVVMRASDGRWEITGDGSTAKKACFQVEKLQWQLVGREDECADGFTFTGPRDPYQNYLLHKTLQDTQVKESAVINVPV